METDGHPSRGDDEQYVTIEEEPTAWKPSYRPSGSFFQVDHDTGTDRCFKIQYALYALTITWFFASNFHLLTVNFVLAMGVFGAFVPWLVMWLHLLATAEGLWNVKVATARIDGWTKVSVPQKVRLLKDRSVLSISHLSGIRGTILNLNLRVVIALSEMITFVAILQDVSFRDAPLLRLESREDLVPFAFMLFVSGGFLVGHFELNTFDSLHFAMHHVGVVLQLFGVCSLGFVTDWSRTAVALIAGQFVFVLLWVGAVIAVPKRSSDERKVTRASKLCISLELVVFTFNVTSHALAIHGSGANQGNVWASIFK